jgi:hypothetical protein
VGCDLVVGETQDPETLRLEVGGSIGFVSPIVGRVVDLEDDPEFETGEIGDSGSDGDLASESGSGGPVLDPAPEACF